MLLKLCSVSWTDGGGTGLADEGDRDEYLAPEAAARLGARRVPPAAAIKLMKYSELFEM